MCMDKSNRSRAWNAKTLSSSCLDIKVHKEKQAREVLVVVCVLFFLYHYFLSVESISYFILGVKWLFQHIIRQAHFSQR